MQKDLAAVIASDKSKAFVIVKELHPTSWHGFPFISRRQV
jgi:hypothetical protein